MKKRVLGRGLESIISAMDEKAGTSPKSVLYLSVEQVRPNPHQPRRAFAGTEEEELIRSIGEKGMIQPILVRKAGSEFHLIAGERRLRAARKAGLSEVPALVVEAEDADSLEMALAENLMRKDLNPIEEARGYLSLMEEFGMSHNEVAVKVGKDRATVANTLRLLKVPDEIARSLERGEIMRGHALALLGAGDSDSMLQIFQEVVRRGLSVRATENIVKRSKSKAQKARGDTYKEVRFAIESLTQRLITSLGTRVKIIDRGKKGKIQIEYYSWEELNRLVNLIKKD